MFSLYGTRLSVADGNLQTSGDSPDLAQPPSLGGTHPNQSPQHGVPHLRYAAGVPMDYLIDLVAASFARNGIECPTPKATPASETEPKQPSELPALPDHNFKL